MSDVKIDSKTSAPRDSLRPKTSAITRKIAISDITELVPTSPRSPTSPKAKTHIPMIKESDLDTLDVETMKFAAPAILYSRDKQLEQNKVKVTQSPEYVKTRREKFLKEEEELKKQIEQNKKILAQQHLNLEQYSNLLGRMGLTLDDLSKVEPLLNDTDKELQTKQNQVTSIKKTISDLEMAQLDRIKKVESDTHSLNSQIQSCLDEHKSLVDKTKQKDLAITQLNQKLKDKENELNAQVQYKERLDSEVRALEAELEIKGKEFKILESSVDKIAKDLSNYQSESNSLQSAQTSLLVEKENLGKNTGRLNIGIGVAILLSVGAFTQSFLSKKNK